MRCVDVNVLVYAHRADLPENRDYLALLEQLANAEEPLRFRTWCSVASPGW